MTALKSEPEWLEDAAFEQCDMLGSTEATREQWACFDSFLESASVAGDSILMVVIKAVFILVFLLLSVLFAVWFERRVIARFQERKGPNRHGPLGLVQPIADAMKLMFKEDITVRAADRVLYIVAPMISVFCAFLVFAVIPFGPAVRIPWTDDLTPLQLTDFPSAMLYILACAALGVYGIVLGGWASGSTYPLMGSVRSTAQVISYELGMGLSLVTVFMLAGSMSMAEIVDAQVGMWWVLPLLPAFVLYVISMIGETNRLPFDLPEAEGELVAGYFTEYSSIKFAWFFLAEYINMINVSAVAATLFLGGWRFPVDDLFGWDPNGGFWPMLWLVIKIWALMFVFVWIRGTLLRLRYDQFMRFGWKVLIPAGLIWVGIYGIGRVYIEATDGSERNFAIAAPIVAIILAVAVALWRADEGEEDESSEEPTEPVEIDPFADGYPVPPRPGEVLPPSPRTGRTVDVSARKGDKR